VNAHLPFELENCWLEIDGRGACLLCNRVASPDRLSAPAPGKGTHHPPPLFGLRIGAERLEQLERLHLFA